jgi:hypothetical protein
MNARLLRILAHTSSLFIVLIFTCSAWAGEQKTRGVGVAPITKDVASAKRVSLMLAKRDAVERALGAEVQVESIPSQELKKITATTSGKLSFKVLSEGKEGNVYVTEIEAVVEISPELESKYPRSAEDEVTGFKPLVQKFARGELNWEDGFLIAYGAARKKGSDEKSVAEARRAALLDAYGAALEMIAGVNLDSQLTIQERLKKSPAIEYRIKGLVRGSEVIEESDAGNAYQVKIKVPLRGIKGITRAFTETMNLQRPDGPPKKAEGENVYTGVIVDVRGLGAMPAVFPEIVDEDGEVIYDVKTIDPQNIALRGMAAYVIGEQEDEGGKKGAWYRQGNFLRVAAVTVEPAPISFLGGAPVSRLGPETFFRPFDAFQSLVQAARRIVIRQGPRPVQVRASAKAGPTRSRIVVTRTASAQIKQARTQNDFLRQGRVVVISDSMIGGTEGKFRSRFKYITASR